MDQEYQIEIGEVMGVMKCLRDFKCYKSGFEVLCEARSVGDGDESYLVCLEEYPKKCPFASVERGYICDCPLRVYIANELKK